MSKFGNPIPFSESNKKCSSCKNKLNDKDNDKLIKLIKDIEHGWLLCKSCMDNEMTNGNIGLYEEYFRELEKNNLRRFSAPKPESVKECVSCKIDLKDNNDYVFVRDGDNTVGWLFCKPCFLSEMDNGKIEIDEY